MSITKDEYKLYAGYIAIGVAYVGLCYISYKAFGRIIAKEVVKLLV